MTAEQKYQTYQAEQISRYNRLVEARGQPLRVLPFAHSSPNNQCLSMSVASLQFHVLEDRELLRQVLMTPERVGVLHKAHLKVRKFLRLALISLTGSGK